MIVSYEGVRGGLLMREVNTEEEAFAEMRRFLKVNDLSSNFTTVSWAEANEDRGILARHKYVCMTNVLAEGASFGIYYEGHPTHFELGSEEKWGIKREKILLNRNLAYYYKSSASAYVCWYDEVTRYFQDLAERKAGGG